jgi:HAD superfamily hydrolase (TIGR01490 family)
VQAAFFDLDETVIAKASMVAFGRPLYDAGMISRWLVVRAMWSNLLFHYLGADEERMRKFRTSALRITRGWDQALVSAIVRDTLTDVIEPIVYVEALELIREHQAAGRRVFIISASPEEIVAPLAQYLGVDEAIASRAQLDDEGRYTGEVEFWSYGPYKADAMREAAERLGIDLTESYAYSDSATDVPMLEAVGHPVAVNPDRDLARIAAAREWEVRHFQHGVPLRERVNMPPPGKAFALAATVTGIVTAGALGYWWYRRVATTAATRPRTVPMRARAALQGVGNQRPSSLARRSEGSRSRPAVSGRAPWPARERRSPRGDRRSPMTRQKHSGPSGARRRWTGSV